MGEFAGNYIAGYGEIATQPTEKYIPFLYSVNVPLCLFILSVFDRLAEFHRSLVARNQDSGQRHK